MSTIADLVSLLESAGFTVAPPGDNTTALPCVVLSPVGYELVAGTRLLYPVVDICPAVNASPWTEQYDAAFAMAVEVHRTLNGSQYQYAPGLVPMETDTTRSSPAIFHRINVRFAGPDLCPPEP